MGLPLLPKGFWKPTLLMTEGGPREYGRKGRSKSTSSLNDTLDSGVTLFVGTTSTCLRSDTVLGSDPDQPHPIDKVSKSQVVVGDRFGDDTL